MTLRIRENGEHWGLRSREQSSVVCLLRENCTEPPFRPPSHSSPRCRVLQPVASGACPQAIWQQGRRWKVGRRQQFSRQSRFRVYIRRNRPTFRSFGFRLGGGEGATFFGRPESGFIRHQPPPPCRLSSTPTRSKSVRALDVAGASGCGVPPRIPSGLRPRRDGLSHVGLQGCCLLGACPLVLRSGRCVVVAESLTLSGPRLPHM